jgi:hypothetical protein
MAKLLTDSPAQKERVERTCTQENKNNSPIISTELSTAVISYRLINRPKHDYFDQLIISNTNAEGWSTTLSCWEAAAHTID